MITTDKILAHKTDGKNLVLLSQVGSSYFLTIAQIKTSRLGFFGTASKQSIQILAEREVTESEACLIFKKLTSSVTSAQCALIEEVSSVQTHEAKSGLYTDTAPLSEILLITSPMVRELEPETLIQRPSPRVSPYFPLKEILLSVQQTRAPSVLYTC